MNAAVDVSAMDGIERRVAWNGARNILTRTVFCLLKPDALAAAKVQDIVDYLEGTGFRVLDCRVCWQTHPRQFERLYTYNIDKWSDPRVSASWWLHIEYFTSGPVVTLLLFDVTPASGKSTYQRLGALKGPANPADRAPGQLRYELNATNRMINLFHAADDPSSTAREYLIFHPPDRLDAALARATQRRFLAPDQIRELVELVDAPRHDLDFVDAIVRLKNRLRYVLDGHPAAPRSDELDDVYAAYQRLTRTGGDRAARVGALYRLAEWEARVLAAAGTPVTDPLLDAFATLARLPALGGHDAEQVLGVLAAHRVHVTHWERLVVLTSCHFVSDLLEWVRGQTGERDGCRC